MKEKLMRYLPLTDEDRSEMLARVGVADIDALFAGVPADKLLRELPDLPRRKSEIEVERTLRHMAEKNVAAGSVPFFVGCGAYKHHVPEASIISSSARSSSPPTRRISRKSRRGRSPICSSSRLKSPC